MLEVVLYFAICPSQEMQDYKVEKHKRYRVPQSWVWIRLDPLYFCKLWQVPTPASFLFSWPYSRNGIVLGKVVINYIQIVT